MRTALLILLTVVGLGSGSIRAQDVPFAQAPLPMPGRSPMTSQRGLSDIMLAIQMRHAKLWFAGTSKNWPLAAFEVDRIRDDLLSAGMMYQNIPVSPITNASQNLDTLHKAIDGKDQKTFKSNSQALTQACNGCHLLGEVGFIEIRIPTQSPFGNQSFDVPKKAR